MSSTTTPHANHETASLKVTQPIPVPPPEQVKATQPAPVLPADQVIEISSSLCYELYGELSHPDDKAFVNSEGKDVVTVPLASLSLAALDLMLFRCAGRLGSGDAASVRNLIIQNAPDTIRTVADFHAAFMSRRYGTPEDFPTAQIEIGGKLYPCRPELKMYRMFGTVQRELHVKNLVGDLLSETEIPLSNSAFVDADGVPTELTYGEALVKVGLHPSPTFEEHERYKEKLSRANAFKANNGRMLAASGPALVYRRLGWWKKLVPCRLGTPGEPAQVIAEAELDSEENKHRNRRDMADVQELPFVRCFDLRRREYLYCDVDDLQDYQYNPRALDKLAVDPDYRAMLENIFAAGRHADDAHDLVAERSGGIIVLASGPPGTGKTMTAEVIAETTCRPLYIVGLKDLGTDLAEVHENLDDILVRAERWNALILIDEADVILATRGGDLVRSAIVGEFLHRIEYYRGYLFLTSNRPETLDPAVLSRVTLHRRYGKLSLQNRRQIWRSLLANADLTLSDAVDQEPLFAQEVDGRRIRSTVKLARLAYPAGSTVAAHDLLNLMDQMG